MLKSSQTSSTVVNTSLLSRRHFCIGLGLLASGCATSTPKSNPVVTRLVLPPPQPTFERAQILPDLLLNRVTWGATASSSQKMRRVGMDAYVDQQLRAKSSVVPEIVQKQIDQMTISQTPFMTLMRQLEQQRIEADQQKGVDDSLKKAYQQELTRIAKEAGSRSILRAIHSENQLHEQMVWFWMNHFNVHSGKHNVRAMLGDYEENAIRPFALGTFKDLLYSVVFHPAMLRYLDNEHNAVNHINENFARELLELHTMGVDSGYTQRDVQELARVLTGVGIRFDEDPAKIKPQLQKLYLWRNGFEFHPHRHDFGDKKILGRTIQGRGLGELDEILNMLCHEPATARFISKKLAIYFVSDTPSNELIEGMAQRFLQTEGHIPSVLRAMFDSPEFIASLGNKMKDPVHYVISSLRLAYDGTPIVNALPVLNWLNGLGEQLNGHQTPDGYSMLESAWNSPGQMTARFEFARNIASGNPALFRVEGQEMLNKPPAPVLATSAYVKEWASRCSAMTQQALAQAKNPQEWGGFFLASPEMMHR